MKLGIGKEDKFEINEFDKTFHLNLLGNNEKGSTLVEILISMAILSFLLMGILQMFSAAFIINQRSATKTMMAYKCQQVAEVLRMVWNINRRTGMLPANALDSGIVFQDGSIVILPYRSGDQHWAYWGPNGANIIENPDAPCRLFYRITTDPLNHNLILTVTAVEAREINDGEDPYVAKPTARRIEYVLQLQNNL